MKIDEVLADMAVSDMDAATAWYGRLFGRPADTNPMEGLAEWHFPGGGAVQVSLYPERAGMGLLTLSMSDLEAEVEQARKRDVGIDAVDPVGSAKAMLVTVADPDGNAISLVQPR